MKRNRTGGERREQKAVHHLLTQLDELMRSHEEERDRLGKEW